MTVTTTPPHVTLAGIGFALTQEVQELRALAPTCPTCDGSGKVRHNPSLNIEAFDMQCPDCVDHPGRAMSLAEWVVLLRADGERLMGFIIGWCDWSGTLETNWLEIKASHDAVLKMAGGKWNVGPNCQDGRHEDCRWAGSPNNPSAKCDCKCHAHAVLKMASEP